MQCINKRVAPLSVGECTDPKPGPFRGVGLPPAPRRDPPTACVAFAVARAGGAHCKYRARRWGVRERGDKRQLASCRLSPLALARPRAVSRSWPPTRPAGRKSYTPEPLCASSCAQGFGNSDAPDCPGSAAAEKSTSKPELAPGFGSAVVEKSTSKPELGPGFGSAAVEKKQAQKAVSAKSAKRKKR